mmetsp:Transcript_25556/g.55872  ORF Transcript_25556/g.55872 Transcript_25556/m.55872 type:complete len:93 (-) Transcript_25556:887-1165(-)
MYVDLCTSGRENGHECTTSMVHSALTSCTRTLHARRSSLSPYKSSFGDYFAQDGIDLCFAKGYVLHIWPNERLLVAQVQSFVAESTRRTGIA